MNKQNNPEQPQQIAAFYQEMLRFARLQLRDQSLSEDVTQEAITAALERNNYRADGELRSWVFAILRHKIIDCIRERSRHPTDHFENDDELDRQFRQNDHWQRDHRPADWHNPEDSFSNQQFWLILETCLNQLPQNPARVFMMREHLGLEVKDICRELAISESNCWVLMHRARMRLRKCLEINFMQQEQPAL